MRSKTVLILDRDLGFVFWLGQNLDRAGHQAYPAKSTADAITLLGRFHLDIDLLVVNPALDGALSLANTLMQSHRDLKVLVTSQGDVPPDRKSVAWHSWKRKPAALDRRTAKEWLEAIEQVCSPSVHSWMHGVVV